MQPHRWFEVGSAQGARPGADERAADQTLLGGDAKLLIVSCPRAYDLGAALVVLSAA